MAPMIGFHSVIESPESVRRVAPPTRIMATMSTAIVPSQILRARACPAALETANGAAFDVAVEDIRSDSGRAGGTQWQGEGKIAAAAAPLY